MGLASSPWRARRVNVREHIPTIAGEAGVRPEGAKFFFSQIAKSPNPFGLRLGLLALTGLQWVKGDNLSYFAVVAGCDLETEVKGEPSVWVLVRFAFSRVLVHNGARLFVAVCVKH